MKVLFVHFFDSFKLLFNVNSQFINSRQTIVWLERKETPRKDMIYVLKENLSSRSLLCVMKLRRW